MKNVFLAVSTLILLSTAAKAETFNCVFTEPFISFTYSTSKETLALDVMGEKNSVMKKVSFQVDAKGQYLLKASNGRLIATLVLNNEGSDGMSDIIYPYSARFRTSLYGDGKIDLYGGCESTLLKRTEPEEGI